VALQPVSNRLVLTLTGGSASVVSAGGNPADGGNGDIQRLFQITSGSSFTVRADVQASNSFHALGYALTGLYDPTQTPPTGTSDFSKVDVGFYFSNCGDGVIDSPEQCDAGGANGTPASCCTATCTFRSQARSAGRAPAPRAIIARCAPVRAPRAPVTTPY
jgi:hypothetical protein